MKSFKVYYLPKGTEYECMIPFSCIIHNVNSVKDARRQCIRKVGELYRVTKVEEI